MAVKAPELGMLRVLLVEDSRADADRVAAQVAAAGIQAGFQRVQDEAGLQAALATFKPDLVLAELHMPGMSGFQALDIVRRAQPELPFLFLSSTTGEDTAVAALQRGASDYIIKQQPARLPSAVVRAVREARAHAERQRVEAELMRAQRLESLSLLAAGLSHDLRNILQPLLIMPELLKARTDDPRLRHLADVIAECGRRGHEMAQSMLSFVRGSSTPKERVPVRDLFDAVQLLLRGTLPHGVALQVAVEDESLAVDGNYTELQQVLVNLALNAIQAMPRGGRLWLRASAPAGHDGRRWVCIAVADEGEGMDAATRRQLFTPFFTTKADGTGLGLMSCKRIVEGCGGRIDVHSTPGQGSCFELHLPAAEADAVDAQASRVPAGPAGRGEPLLVVDGEATRLSLLGNALSSQGYQLQLAADGAAAVRRMRRGPMPVLAIVDGNGPLSGTRHVLHALSAQGFKGPVLMLEGDGADTADRAAPPPGIVVRVLRRPLQMQQVFHAVAAALEALAPR